MMDHEGRISRLRAKLGASEVDALLVTNLTNVRYLTGFSGTNGQVLVTANDAVFFTDPRYAARSRDLVSGAEVEIYDTKLTDVLLPRLNGASVTRLGFESQTITVADRDRLDSILGDFQLVAVDAAVEALRRVKEPAEVVKIHDAVRIADAAFAWALDRITPGATEREVALDLEVRMRSTGAEAISFDPIVGSGPLSAHIHHTPTARPLDKGDLILLDFGCKVDGYCSDMTRTVVMGPASDEQREIYATVLAAQLAGITEARPGVPGKQVDAAARKVVDDAGHAEHFPHSLGHGVGLDIHETPALKTSEVPLVPGEAVTVEPGIYLDGKGGIRIEDVIIVTETGREVLTTAPKDALLEL